MDYHDIKTPWEGWRVINKIGKGGFGSVYEIERSQYGIQERAAMKVITIPQSADEIDDLLIEGYDNNSITQRFDAFAEDIVREYGMMAQMKGNANIVYCDDYRIIQQDNGFGREIYIRMELLTPLLKAMDQVSSESQIIRFGMDMCNALDACQKRKVIHRDIKPQNIFVSNDGVFKLGDFGIARKAEKTTRATVGKGTYQFMAPEVKNERPYGPTVDIYSLGLVMYWLMNSRRCPFFPIPPAVPTHKEEQEALYRRFSGEQIPPPQNGSEELKRIVLKACAFEPKDRYQTAQEMRDDLVRLSSGYLYMPDQKTISDSETVPISDYDEDETVGPVFNRIPDNHQIEEEKTVGPVFKSKSAYMDETDVMEDIWAQQPPVSAPPKEDLDVHKTMQFSHDDNPAGKVIAVQVGNDTTRVLIPQQFENGQTLYYEGMGLKSAYSEARGNLYLTVSVVLVAAPVTKTPIPSEKPKKKWAILVSIVALCALIITMFWPIYGEWSEWSEQLSDDTSSIKVESVQQYRYRDKVLNEYKNLQSESSEREFIQQWDEWSEYSSWSDWQSEAIQPNEQCEVESEVHYRSRDVYVTEGYSNWGDWGQWSTAVATQSDTVDVQNREVYYYNVYRYTCPCNSSLGTMSVAMLAHARKFHNLPEEQLLIYNKWLIQADTSITSGEALSAAGFTYVSTALIGENERLYVDTSSSPYQMSSGGTTWYTYSAEPSLTLKQYRVRTRKWETTQNYSEWSDYTKDVLHSDDDTEVEALLLYRYRTREMITVYQYKGWSDWSDWQSEIIAASKEREIEEKTFYRYAYKYCLWEKLLGKT